MNKDISIYDLAPLIIEQLNIGKEVSFTVTGNSMLPFYKNRVTKVTLIKPNKLKRKDVVFYKNSNNQYLLHRILKVKDDTLIICGDGVKTIECELISNVIGKVLCYKTKKKVIYESSFVHKVLVTLWLFLYPIRRILLKILRLIKIN